MANIITLANLFCGIISISSAINGRYTFAAWVVLAAVILDIIDGKIARFFKSSSSRGKELDSLSDLVSFGIAPFVLIYLINLRISNIALVLLSLYVLCAAWRLAKFNVLPESQPKTFFEGLPTTAAGGCIASVFLALQKINFGFNRYILLILAVILALLMVSKIKYPSFKQEKAFKPKYIIGSAIILIFLFIAPAIIPSLIFLMYVLFSPLLSLKDPRLISQKAHRVS